jgi:hypothetical protein
VRSFKTYGEAFKVAQEEANASGMSRGIEKPIPPYNQWSVITLPRPQNRNGHELRCQVVATEHADRVARGYEADVGLPARTA